MTFKWNYCYKSLFFICILLIPFQAIPESIQLTLDDVAKIFSTYFPKAEGVVSKVSGKEATFNIGWKSGMVKGMVLVVYRPGSKFFDEITKEPLGNFEDELGFIELTDLEENESRGIAEVPQDSIRPGDHVRLSAARITVSVTGESDKRTLLLMDEFSRFLIDTNRFSVSTFTGRKSFSRGTATEPPLYEFKLKVVEGDKILVELVNRPFNHQVTELTASIGSIQDLTGGSP